MTFQEMIETEEFQNVLEDALITFTARTQDLAKAMPELRARALFLQEALEKGDK